MTFIDWLEDQGCSVEITQEDDGSGYVYLDVETSEGMRFVVSVETKA